ncbi:MAG: hypothetical protein OMM_03876 [Candidatus Magnetoglobus multicellularis str. Araruama]|uniref:Protein kinase domain-containing protein n=1 Tax=Candidatus Magnetoglobus multicellularis str. Araruama TaxID=890399 RepID=A0A1V1P3V3_9BACT|nr:MAG: hypothetical protein OMM_03876 [Candidatus Magnetoglobus multicellularis str. Araruama]
MLQTDELIRLLFLTADALDQIHTKQWVHMNLSLDHMLVDSTDQNVFIIDWQSAIKMSGYTIIRPPFYSENPDTIPPELTGFTNDCVDMRTDLYALGCIFYELFTHSPIFREKNLFRQIQAHVLQKPVPPHEGYDPYAPIVQHVPESVSNILMKLLAKNPSERYSSARELKVDIFKCLTDKASLTTVDLPKMALPQVRINSNLYEREETIDKIQSIYNSFAQQSFTDGISTLLLISGESGTGKTTLCKTLIPWLWKTNGYWFHDSFSCTPDLPAAMFARILSHFFKLTQAHFPNELESQIKQMTYKGLICPPFLLELIPELIPLTAHILPSSQSRNQIISAEPFLMAMFQMLGAKFYPMILCLENLQWADAVSLHLLEKLLQNNNQSFFVIATCDSEEQPAIKTLSTSCQAQNINVYAIGVNNLSQKAVCKCLVDMFNCSFDHAEKISDVVYEKTSGSPRNLHAFLDYLKNQKTMIHEDTPLNFDEAMTIPFHSSLTNLNNHEIMALEKVSCLGISWQMDIACHVTGLPLSEMESLIQKAATFGIISPDLSQSNANRTNNTWIFSDVAMHGYFYQNLSQSQCQNIHKRICNHMSGSMAQNSGSALLYLIASHRSRYPVDNTSKEEFARVYISAGERALMAGLFQSAHVFLNTA